MFEKIIPEKAGISSKHVLKFMKELDTFSPGTHGMIMMRGGKIFHECYYEPFDENFKHRMYSISKSFVGIAMGILIGDGSVRLDDKMLKFFPEYVTGDESEYIKELTIHDMLTMSTAATSYIDWFRQNTDDRCKMYFKEEHRRIPGTIFEYDSPAAYMLGVIVEKISGKPFLKLMQERFLDDAGFSKDAYCLNAPGGYSLGDSGVMCTLRDLVVFAKFLMDGGRVNGEARMDSDYIRAATTKQVDNNSFGLNNYSNQGYGYQIWMSYDGAFSFNGMGGQFAVCDPKHDFIFALNADNQGNVGSNYGVFQALYTNIIANLGDALAEDSDALNELCEYSASRKLCVQQGALTSDFADRINGVTYKMDSNPMGIENIRIDIDGDDGKFTYTNATGEKVIPFGFGHNVFSLFPEEGYSDMTAGAPCPGNKYKCACSAVWAEPKKLRIKVLIIDKYFGGAAFTFSYKDNRVALQMTKNAEAFLDEYSGMAMGKAQ